MSNETLPSWLALTQHEVMAKASHDDVARLNFLTHLNVHLSSQILPGVREVYEQEVKPAIIEATGSEPQDRHQIRSAMLDHPYYQFWSALRRNTMEMRHQVGRGVVLEQIEDIVAKVDALNQGADTLELDDALPIPDNVGLVDIHCQPGCYYEEYFPNDVTVAASYDIGLFVTTAGLLGGLSDGGGQAIAKWLKEQQPGFAPKRILDIGCTIGHNIVPLAEAFPDAEVIAVDVARPSLRYAHARAKALGVNNIRFVQANGEDLSRYADGSFDLISTSMFLHETSHQSMPNILAEIHRLLAPGGVCLHLEQPQYDGMPVFEQFMRDWDTYFNNEPYWGPMHELDLAQMVADSGFGAQPLEQIGLVSLVDESIFGKRSAGDAGEDYGRAPVWNAFLIWKAA